MPQSEDQDQPVVLRFSESGKSINGGDANGNETNDFFERLAARSRGIPWVAWHLWRRSLRTGPGPDQKDHQKFPGERTIWVAPLKEFRLPEAEADAGRLVLHSLLIHECLTMAKSNPSACGRSVWSLRRTMSSPVPHLKLWDRNISNSNDGERTLMCVTNFYVTPNHDADRVRDVLRNVAMTSAYLEYDKPVLVMLVNEPWGTRYRVKAYPFDMRDQFAFISDVTVRGKAALASIGCTEVSAPYAGRF